MAVSGCSRPLHGKKTGLSTILRVKLKRPGNLLHQTGFDTALAKFVDWMGSQYLSAKEMLELLELYLAGECREHHISNQDVVPIPDIIFSRRLDEDKYYDMNRVIVVALDMTDKELGTSDIIHNNTAVGVKYTLLYLCPSPHQHHPIYDADSYLLGCIIREYSRKVLAARKLYSDDFDDCGHTLCNDSHPLGR